MHNRWIIVMGCVLVALLVVAGIVTVLKIDLTPMPEKGKAVVRTRNLGEGIRLTRHGLYGIDIVSIGKAHTRKLRKGPFMIGAINELVLEDVSLALPTELWKSGRKEMVKGDDGQMTVDDGPKAMLRKLGITPGQLKMGAKMPRFSALAIRNLQVSRIEGTNAVSWFAASRAEAERGMLKLQNGWSVENGVTNRWKLAFLGVDPGLRLSTVEN